MIGHYLGTAPTLGANCEFQPDLWCWPMPPCWLRTATAQARLDLAAATLRHYAVATVARYNEDAYVGHQRIVEALRHQFPTGVHSYVFWTAADDSTAFTSDGKLARDLTLHHSPDISDALTTVLDTIGLAHRPGRHPQATILASSA